MTVSDNDRARVLMHNAIGRSYGEIANHVDGVSKHQAGRIVREARDAANADGGSAEQVVLEEVMNGMATSVSGDIAGDMALAFLNA